MPLYLGDCIQVMKSLISEGVKVDAVITDPPYGRQAVIGIMLSLSRICGSA